MKKFFLLLISLSLYLLPLDAAPFKTQVFFSPQDEVADHLIEFIDKEEESIRAAVYCLTHRGIIQALIRAKGRGVDVEVIIDPFCAKSKTLQTIASAEIPFFVWDPVMPENKRKKPPLMHNKFCLFGEKRIWTGSFNFTYDGTRYNHENVVVFENQQAAGKYQKEFISLKEGCRPYGEFIEKINAKKKTTDIIAD